MAEKPELPLDAARITGRRTVRADDTMAGDDHKEGIAAAGGAHGPHRLRSGDAGCQRPVGQGGAQGNAPERVPDIPLEAGSGGIQGQVKLVPQPGEVFLELVGRRFEDWRGRAVGKTGARFRVVRVRIGTRIEREAANSRRRGGEPQFSDRARADEVSNNFGLRVREHIGQAAVLVPAGKQRECRSEGVQNPIPVDGSSRGADSKIHTGTGSTSGSFRALNRD